MTQFNFNDGGRADAGFKGQTGDCVTRAISIVAQKPYIEVYEALHRLNQEYADQSWSTVAKKIRGGKGRNGTTPRNGVFKEVYHPYILSLGMKWTPCMKIGQGCKVHLRASELPVGRIIVRVSKHLTTLIDGVIHDIFDPQRETGRCVYGYYSFE